MSSSANFVRHITVPMTIPPKTATSANKNCNPGIKILQQPNRAIAENNRNTVEQDRVGSCILSDTEYRNKESVF
eukprot:scaffold5787_cov111-Cylindrotheca_fusiformis.AAC.2